MIEKLGIFLLYRISASISYLPKCLFLRDKAESALNHVCVHEVFLSILRTFSENYCSVVLELLKP